jgi:sugar phosphate isomerase/epimerase
MVHEGNDPIREIKLLGKKHICDCHVKEGGHFLGASGKIDWKAVADVLRDIEYEGWFTLETSCPTGDVVADTRRNAAFVRETFARS